MGQKDPEAKAVGYANTNTTSLYNAAKRKELPRASSVGWALVKSIALNVFERGGTAAEVKKAVFEAASRPVPVHEGEKVPVRSPWAINGRVIKKGGG